MKHWYTTAVAGEKDDGTRYTVCTQKFFIDSERFLADLSDVFINAGIGLTGTPLRAYVARNSTGMADSKGVRLLMAPVSDVPRIVTGALAAGYGNKPAVQDAMAYVLHLTNVLAKNAMAAYVTECAKTCIPEPPDDTGSQGDDAS